LKSIDGTTVSGGRRLKMLRLSGTIGKRSAGLILIQQLFGARIVGGLKKEYEGRLPDEAELWRW
jgi:hypothetical protein